MPRGRDIEVESYACQETACPLPVPPQPVQAMQVRIWTSIIESYAVISPLARCEQLRELDPSQAFIVIGVDAVNDGLNSSDIVDFLESPVAFLDCLVEIG